MPSFNDRLDAICERYKISTEGRSVINHWANEREILAGSHSRFVLSPLRATALQDIEFKAGFEQMMDAVRTDFGQLLDAICKRYKLSFSARVAVVKWADERELLAGSSERVDALQNAGIYVVKRVLLTGLKAVEPTRRWSPCSALHLEYYGHQIVIGSDESKKARFIAACKAVG